MYSGLIMFLGQVNFGNKIKRHLEYVYFSSRNDSVFCHYCRTQEEKGNLRDQGKKDMAYISKGFSSWKKAPKCFSEHQSTTCHRTAASYCLVVPECKNVDEMIDKNTVKIKEAKRKYLLDVINCLRYLSRQGIALQGNDENDNFTQLLRLLGTKDPNIMKHLDGSVGYKYTHHDIQNEILNIMASHVLRRKLEEIRECRFFALILDEYTDVINLEQLSFSTRTVDEKLNVNEDFLGFYEIDNIRSSTIVGAVKDILLRFNLDLSDCRGQTYDGASNMLGKRSGVATELSSEQPKAVVTHCQGHSLSLAVKSLTNDCKILRDTMGTVGEICILVKYSPKREKLLGKIVENIEGEIPENDFCPGKLNKLSTTRWTVRATCFQKVIDNYEHLLRLWSECLTEKLDSETKSRIIGCQSQMTSFSFYFGLRLGQILFGMTDNLSKTLQKEKMSALSGINLSELTIKTLQGMRSEENFLSFFEVVKKGASKIDSLKEPSLPRKRKRPDYSILTFVEGYEGSNESFHPDTPADHFKQIYFEALDAIINAIKDRFNQPGYQTFSNVEQLLLKAIAKVNYEDELKQVSEVYAGDFDALTIKSELYLLPTIFKNSSPCNFDDIVKKFQEAPQHQQQLIATIIAIVRLVLTCGATSATPERSFSMARRLKTWLRATMSQKRFNSLSILNTYKEILDDLSSIDIANDFLDGRSNRHGEFGTFTENDLSS